MGERVDKLKDAIRNRISDNIRKNLGILFILVYAIGLVVWNLTTLLIVGDINIALFWNLLIDSINLPVIIILAITWTGKWKTLNFEKEMSDTAHRLEIEHINEVFELKKEKAVLEKELEMTQKLQVQYELIEKQRRELMYARNISEYQLRYIAMMANMNWEEVNKKLEDIDKEVVQAVNDRLSAIDLCPPTPLRGVENGSNEQ